MTFNSDTELFECGIASRTNHVVAQGASPFRSKPFGWCLCKVSSDKQWLTTDAAQDMRAEHVTCVPVGLSLGSCFRMGCFISHDFSLKYGMDVRMLRRFVIGLVPADFADLGLYHSVY